MAAKALLTENPHPTREQIAEWLSGNICRCGAYGAIAQSILEAAEAISKVKGFVPSMRNIASRRFMLSLRLGVAF